MISPHHRVRLAAGTAGCAVAAVVLAAFPVGPVLGLQIALAVGALACFTLSGFGHIGLSGALLCVIAEGTLTARPSDVALVTLPLTGLAALGAVEGCRLCAIWSGAGTHEWAAERLHVAGAARRLVLAATATAIVAVAGRAPVPASVFIGVLAVVASALVIWIVLEPARWRSTSSGLRGDSGRSVHEADRR